ncbi:hypothetical protein D3C86_1204290 [compost metagenome]
MRWILGGKYFDHFVVGFLVTSIICTISVQSAVSCWLVNIPPFFILGISQYFQFSFAGNHPCIGFGNSFFFQVILEHGRVFWQLLSCIGNALIPSCGDGRMTGNGVSWAVIPEVAQQNAFFFQFIPQVRDVFVSSIAKSFSEAWAIDDQNDHVFRFVFFGRRIIR